MKSPVNVQLQYPAQTQQVHLTIHLATMNGDHQDVKDLASAREQSEVEIPRVRNFVYGESPGRLSLFVSDRNYEGGRDKWEEHSKLVNIMSNDPVFDKLPR